MAKPRAARDAAAPVRDTTRNLVEAIWLDVWPRNGAIVDFGLKSQEHYESLYYPVREGEITPGQLDAALGKGEKLTVLARSARSNPHRDIEFRTDWDDLLPEPDPDANGERLPSPGDIADGQCVGQGASYQQMLGEASRRAPRASDTREKETEIDR